MSEIKTSQTRTNFPSWDLIKERVKNCYTEEKNGYWKSNVDYNRITINKYTYSLSFWLFILKTKQNFDNNKYILQRLCIDTGCINPEHHGLVSKNTTSDKKWQ